jgi:hypothetical protein
MRQPAVDNRAPCVSAPSTPFSAPSADFTGARHAPTEEPRAHGDKALSTSQGRLAIRPGRCLPYRQVGARNA